MSHSLRIIIVGILVVIVGFVAMNKRKPAQTVVHADAPKPAVTSSPASADPTAPRPRLVDLGAGKCIPCKMMAPILAELKQEYAGRVDVEFIDVWENTAAAEKYGISSIPTQIFYDAAGRERFRHEGFFGKDEILAKWKELGMLGSASAPAS